MRWSPNVLAGIAQRAGFAGGALTAAVALALQVSGGDDAFTSTDPMPGVRDERGLWGIDVTRWQAAASADLLDPNVNAAAAYKLYTALGGSFDWSGTWVAGIDPALLVIAQEAAGAPSDGQAVDSRVAPPGAVYRSPARTGLLAGEVDRAATAAAVLGRLPRRKA